MKRLFKLIPLPVLLLGLFFSTAISLSNPEPAFAALTCTPLQRSVVNVEGANDRPYAECRDIIYGGTHESCTGATPIAIRVPGFNPVGCFAAASPTAPTIDCSEYLGGNNIPVIEGGREKCYNRAEGGEPCPAGQVRVNTGNGSACMQAANPADAAAPGGDPANPGAADPEAIKDAKTEAECTAAGGEWEDGKCAEKEEPTCGTMATNIGWYLCPLLNAATAFADGMWGVFESLLIIDPLKEDTPVHNVWKVFRNTANVILTIVFLVVIFSQVSNVGISNYGIKKMLPKILIASVAINISFFLMQIAVDLANSLTGILGGTIREAGMSVEAGERRYFVETFEEIIVSLAAVVAGAGAIALAGSMASPVAVLLFVGLLLVPVLFGILAGALTLILRELIIPILAIFAPLAFAFYLLPNTEKIAKKWSSIFVGLLTFSVVAAILYEGAMLVLMIVIAGEESAVLKMAALASIFFLMVLLPFMAFKMNPLTAKAFNGLRNGINKLASPGLGIAKGSMNSRAKRGFAQFKNREYTPGTTRREKAANLFSGRTGARMAQSVVKSYDKGARDRALDTELEGKASEQAYREGVIKNQDMVDKMNKSAAGKKYLQSYENEAIENQATQYENKDGAFMKSEFASARAAGDTVKMRAIVKVIAETGGDPGPRQIRDLIEQHAPNMNDKQYESVMGYMADNHSGLMGKDLVMKEMLTNIYKTDTDQHGNIVRDPSGKAVDRVNKMSVSDAQKNVVAAHSAGGPKMQGMTAAKFAGLSGPDKAEFLDNSAIRQNMPVGLLQELVDPSSAASQTIDAASKKKISQELVSRGAGATTAPAAQTAGSVSSSGSGAAGQTASFSPAPAPQSTPAASSSPRGSNPPGGGSFTQQTASGIVLPKSFGSAPAPSAPSAPPAGGTPVVNNITNNNVTQTAGGSAQAAPAAPATPSAAPAAPSPQTPQPVQFNVQNVPAPTSMSPSTINIPPQFNVPQSNTPQTPRPPQSPNPQPPKPNNGPRPPFGR